MVKFTFQAKVTVVSTSDVVNDALVTVALAFVTRVPLGIPALSVSILIHKLTQGDQNFLKASFNVAAFTQAQKTGNAILLFADTLPIFTNVVADAKEVFGSTKTT
jgi:hypothetical protein